MCNFRFTANSIAIYFFLFLSVSEPSRPRVHKRPGYHQEDQQTADGVEDGNTFIFGLIRFCFYGSLITDIDQAYSNKHNYNMTYGKKTDHVRQIRKICPGMVIAFHDIEREAD